MSTIFSTLAGWSALFVVTILSGVWLSHAGKPFNTLIFTAHKLLAVGTLIIVGRHLYRLQKLVTIRSPLESGALPLTVLLFAVLVLSGALLSLGKPLPDAVLRLHQVVPVLALAATALSLYLLAGLRS